VARDITEGRSGRAIAVDIGLNTGTIWQNTGNAYDCAIAGVPFLTAINDTRPYERVTAPFRKQQFDSQRDPGEQSLSSWWLRSQSSFHAGDGITFYDPLANPYSPTVSSNSYRVREAHGIDIWTAGQATLLNSVTRGQQMVSQINTTTQRPTQTMRGIKYGTTNAYLLHDGFKIYRIDEAGSVTNWVTYTSGTDDPVYALCDDGESAYWVTNDTASGILEMNKKTLSATSGVAPTVMFTTTGVTVANAAIEYIKHRLVLAANNKIYEIPTKATSSTSAVNVYTHPNTSYTFTSICESGNAIYVAGYNGIQSSIFRFVLDTTSGSMPTLTSAITTAEMPVGEKIYKVYYYLGYVCIGTSKGIRIASIQSDGSLEYGPLIVETSQPCYDFTSQDRFIWCATGVDGNPGLIRIDLGNELETLRFAYANDISYDDDSLVSHITTACCFTGDTNKLALATTANTSNNGYNYIEGATLRTSGHIETGLIRFNTLEPKNFKRVLARGNFIYGSMALQVRDIYDNLYDVATFDNVVGSPETTLSQPIGAQDAIGLRFTIYRDTNDATLGSVFKGYQLKAVPATPRTRLITIPLLNFDTETDKYNSTIGYEGRAIERLAALENAEANGDVVIWQDFRTGELRQCLIEEVKFTDVTPPDKRLTGYGGIITLTIRTV